MSNKIKKENLKLSKEKIDRANYWSDFLEKVINGDYDFESPVEVKNTIDFYNTENYHKINANIDKKEVQEIKTKNTHKLTLDFTSYSTINAITDKAEAYKRAVSDINSMFQMIEGHDVGKIFVKKDDSNIMLFDSNSTEEKRQAQIVSTLGVILRELEEYVIISVARFLDYSITLGFSGNIQINEDQNWRKLVGMCVKNALEPILPLFIGYYLYSIGNLYCLNDDVRFELLVSEFNHYTKKDVKSIILAINKINSDFQSGWLIYGDQFFNENIFKGWLKEVTKPKYLKVYQDQIVDVMTPNDFDYNFDFFNDIIERVVSSKLMHLASENKLKLSFRQAVQYEDTKKKS